MWYRRKRLLRLHLVDVPHSVEGVLVGVDSLHYRLAKPSLVTEDGTRDLDGGPELWVPRGRVLYAQVLG